jgi:hypothetical protein
VNEDGSWCPKRLFGFINTWCPGLLVNVLCNNDIKLLLNGAITKKITYYITLYIAKKQGKNFNMSAILANGYAYDLTHARAEYTDKITDQQRLLMFRLVNAINREQEIGAPMVMSYLMGWGDVYRSHTYSVIYWGCFQRILFLLYPSLDGSSQTR